MFSEDRGAGKVFSFFLSKNVQRFVFYRSGHKERLRSRTELEKKNCFDRCPFFLSKNWPMYGTGWRLIWAAFSPPSAVLRLDHAPQCSVRYLKQTLQPGQNNWRALVRGIFPRKRKILRRWRKRLSSVRTLPALIYGLNITLLLFSLSCCPANPCVRSGAQLLKRVQRWGGQQQRRRQRRQRPRDFLPPWRFNSCIDFSVKESPTQTWPTNVNAY